MNRWFWSVVPALCALPLLGGTAEAQIFYGAGISRAYGNPYGFRGPGYGYNASFGTPGIGYGYRYGYGGLGPRYSGIGYRYGIYPGTSFGYGLYPGTNYGYRIHPYAPYGTNLTRSVQPLVRTGVPRVATTYPTSPGFVPLPPSGGAGVPAGERRAYYPPAPLDRIRPAARETPAPAKARTLLTLQVPDGAEVWFDSYKVKQTGPTRTLRTPPLDTGGSYTYTVKVRWTEDGKPRETTKEITVRGGQDRTLNPLADEGR